MTGQIAGLLYGLKGLLFFLLLVRMFASFVPNLNHNNGFMRLVYRLTDPVLAPFQAILPSNNIGVDLSPLFAFLSIDLGISLLVGALP